MAEIHDSAKSKAQEGAERARTIDALIRETEYWMTQASYDEFDRRLARWKKRKLDLLEENRARVQDDGRDEAASQQDRGVLDEANGNIEDNIRYLKFAHIISPLNTTDRVEIGNRVVVRVPEEGADEDREIRYKNEEYLMVAALDQKAGVLTNVRHLGQPLAAAIFQREVGDVVNVVAKDKWGKVMYQYPVQIMQILPGKFEGPRKAQKKPQSS